MSEGTMDQFPYEGYPWLTLGLSRAMLLKQLRDIEDDHRHDFPDTANVAEAPAVLADIRLAIAAAERGDPMTAIAIIDKRWFFYHRRGHRLATQCIWVSNLRYRLPLAHAV